MEETQALALIFSNLGQEHRDKDMLQTAEAVRVLRDIYGSIPKVADRVGYSRDVVRQFYNLSRFSEDIKRLFGKKQLRLDQGDSLWTLNLRRPDALRDAAKAATSLTAHDTRHLVDHLLRHRDSSVEQAVEVIKAAQTVVEHEYHVVTLLPDEDFKALTDAAQERGVPVDVLTTQIVRDWLHGREQA